MSASRIVAIGDIHLKHGHARNGERLRSLDAIVAHGRSLDGLAAWLLLGDVFDAKSSAEDRNAFAERLLLMAAVAPVFIVRGNHDFEGDLLIFGKLEARYPIVVRETADVLTFLLGTQRLLRLFMLPWPSEAVLAAGGVAPAEMSEAARHPLDAIFMQAAAAFDDARRDGAFPLFAAHVTVRGAIASTGQPQIGQGIEIDAAMLARLGDCPKLVGHIHLPQEIGGAVYAGSISANDWAEIERKRFLVLSFDEAGAWMLESVALDTPPLYHVEGDLSRDGFVYEVRKGPGGAVLEKPASWRGCHVRARARFNKSERGILELARAQIYAEFAEAVDSGGKFELELVAVPDTALRAPEVAAAQTLPEKVEAWARVAGVTLPPAWDELLALLETTDGGLLVADEARMMGELLDAPAEEGRAA